MLKLWRKAKTSKNVFNLKSVLRLFVEKTNQVSENVVLTSTHTHTQQRAEIILRRRSQQWREAVGGPTDQHWWAFVIPSNHVVISWSVLSHCRWSTRCVSCLFVCLFVYYNGKVWHPPTVGSITDCVCRWQMFMQAELAVWSLISWLSSDCP